MFVLRVSWTRLVPLGVALLGGAAACSASGPSSAAAGASIGGSSSGSSAGSSAGTSGGAGTSSASGVVTPPPHIVAPCPAVSDAAGSAVGVWTEITPPGVSLDPKYMGFNTGAGGFVIDPSNTATVYLGTCSQGIYKTTDCGSTWIHVNKGTLGASIDAGRNWTMAIDPVQPNVIYTNAGYGPSGLFKSVDSGVNWTQQFPKGSPFATTVGNNFVEFIAIDPTDHAHVVVSSHNPCTGAVAGPVCFGESMDSGATWKMVKGHPAMGYERSGHALIDRKTWVFFDWLAGVFLTQDEGATWTHPFPSVPTPGINPSATNQSGTLYRGNDGTYYVSGLNGVVKTTDLMSWSLIPKSPASFALAGDGNALFVSNNVDNPMPSYSTSTGDFSVWKAYPSPQVTKGAFIMKYDPDHNLLYSTNDTGGFWRVQTK